MTDDINQALPGWFKVVAGLAVVWNLLGVMAYVMQAMMTPEQQKRGISTAARLAPGTS